MKIPRQYKKRIAAAAKAHDFPSPVAFADHLAVRGLARIAGVDVDAADLDARIDEIWEDQGYADRAELVSHLLERGLDAYEAPAEDEETLRERLRGLGYID